ncbi:uncharacterized protein EDB93DRAFT_1101784 [Suillus bovinus]|uniref:uncharacterized protein n=1 Tax=Suillus bovinus TaxID=48563 RepID=UPI001B864280|nr:uncharacterized protein EDB93DRAFT_1101784 [Suillus bovinus]KAG2155194.1 hypothetical protein EDB93DRAFT_1101784 [Suillus bovinus]
MTTYSSQQQILNHAVGIWPMQLPRYAEVMMLKKTDVPRPLKYGNWEEFVHLLGGTYYYHKDKGTYTSVNLRQYQDLQKIDDFVDALRVVTQEDVWILVVHPTMFRGEEKFQYYYVVLDQHIIAWIEELNGYLLFRDCVQPSQWEHKRLELEAQYWDGKNRLAGTEAITLSQSTAGSIFWTLEQMEQIIEHLASIETEDLADNRLIHETGIVFCWHHQYLNCHNQPEARLIRNHAVKEKRRNCKLLCFMSNTAATVFCMPVTIKSVKRTSVDGIVNGVEVKNFVDNLSNQTKSQITLAGVSMALDIAILAVPGLGTTVYYLQKRMAMLVVITSILTSFCVLSMTSSILGFFAGSLIILVIASYSPGLARIRPQ